MEFTKILETALPFLAGATLLWGIGGILFLLLTPKGREALNG